jgi:serpin B
VIVSVVDNAFADSPKQLQEATPVNEISSTFLSSKLRHEGLKNSMVSSVSLYYALSILKGGAANETEALLQSLLLKDAESNITTIAPALAEVLQLPKVSNQMGLGTFNLANSIWSTNGETNNKEFLFAENFKSDSYKYYDAVPYSIDFLASGASEKINTWAEEKTNGLIPIIIDDLTLRRFQWLIINAAYFEGAWANPMRMIRAREDYKFIALDGTKKSVDSIVSRNNKTKVLDMADGSVAFSLPFMGRKYSFIIHLPSEKEEDIASWLREEAVITMPEVVEGILGRQSKVYQLSVRLPKFSFTDQVVMRKSSKIVNDLGFSLLFSDDADFSLIASAEKPQLDTKVGLIKQDTKIELDEKGVKAAAVTLVGGIFATSAAKPRKIIVDQPFSFAIVENSSQTILFNGILVQPE